MTPSLIDTNLLVYRVDPRDALKQQVAIEVLGRLALRGDAFVAHQALVETYSALTRPRGDLEGKSLLTTAETTWVVGSIMREFTILWPSFEVITAAMHGKAGHGLSWYDAHMWAYAATNGIPCLLSEDFEHGRYYDDVRVENPFLQAQGGVHELPPMYA